MPDDQDEPTTYAERMFPAPVDHGIAREDRAVSTVEHGRRHRRAGLVAERALVPGRRRVGEKAVERITIYPPTGGLQTQGDPFEPVRIGILVDMELGQLLADWIDPDHPRHRGRA